MYHAQSKNKINVEKRKRNAEEIKINYNKRNKLKTKISSRDEITNFYFKGEKPVTLHLRFTSKHLQARTKLFQGRETSEFLRSTCEHQYARDSEGRL